MPKMSKLKLVHASPWMFRQELELVLVPEGAFAPGEILEGASAFCVGSLKDEPNYRLITESDLARFIHFTTSPLDVEGQEIRTGRAITRQEAIAYAAALLVAEERAGHRIRTFLRHAILVALQGPRV